MIDRKGKIVSKQLKYEDLHVGLYVYDGESVVKIENVSDIHNIEASTINDGAALYCMEPGCNHYDDKIFSLFVIYDDEIEIPLAQSSYTLLEYHYGYNIANTCREIIFTINDNMAIVKPLPSKPVKPFSL